MIEHTAHCDRPYCPATTHAPSNAEHDYIPGSWLGLTVRGRRLALCSLDCVERVAAILRAIRQEIQREDPDLPPWRVDLRFRDEWWNRFETTQVGELLLRCDDCGHTQLPGAAARVSHFSACPRHPDNQPAPGEPDLSQTADGA